MPNNSDLVYISLNELDLNTETHKLSVDLEKANNSDILDMITFLKNKLLFNEFES